MALAVGGAAGTPASVVLSQHIGDLESPLSLSVFRRAIDDLLEFFAVKPQAVACDLHPDYASTRYAEELARRFQVPIVRVQHHHAHVAACMAEHGLEGPVLGLAWDGTGYGPDGTIWGGEALLCHGADYHRVAHLRTFPLPGGDRAARQPRRAALGLLYEILGPRAFEKLPSPRTCRTRRSGAGQAVRAIMVLGIRATGPGRHARPRAELPSHQQHGPAFRRRCRLVRIRAGNDLRGPGGNETGIRRGGRESAESYSIPLRASESGLIADWEPMIRQILDERLEGEPAGRISARFHNALAGLALDLAQAADCDQVVLTGGCFQNALLTRRVRQRLLEGGFTVYSHQRVPPGDGGIALGQIFVAARQMQGPIDVPGNSR